MELVVAGLTGKEFTQLLGMLCSDFSPQSADVLIHALQRRDYETVSFACFQSSVMVFLIYNAVISSARTVFQALDDKHTGQ